MTFVDRSEISLPPGDKGAIYTCGELWMKYRVESVGWKALQITVLWEDGKTVTHPLMLTEDDEPR
jgi:hypothetical protein